MIRFAVCLIALVGLFPSLHAEDFDADADAKILASAYSAEFLQETVEYPYGEYIYDISIMHNPSGLPLWAENFEWTPRWTLAMLAGLPFELIAHIKELVPELNKERDDFYVDLRGYGEMPLEALQALHPVYIAETIADSKNDAEVQNVLRSTGFEGGVFHYQLDGKQYMVRVLHNPAGQTFSATRGYYLRGNNPKPVTISWNYKYAILMDKQAPQALIDHLSSFVQCSWWDWYYNFQVSNGTDVIHEVRGANITYVYHLDPWFYYTSDLEPVSK